MLFSSMFFLWTFLPIVLIGSRVLKLFGIKAVNLFLLAASLFFYAWGEPVYVVLLLLSISCNYLFGRVLGYFNEKEKDRGRKIVLVLAVVANLAFLGYYKYADFLLTMVNSILGKEVFTPLNIALPIGISFFTFQAMSYVIDLYRKEYAPQKNIVNLALYVSFFPQLIAGPIVKYHEVEAQLMDREITMEKMASGIRRFIFGLAKKVWIANQMGAVADYLFSLSSDNVTGTMAWIAALCYTLQIYYDFSGYSDMAIGLGRMFGFSFLENFRFPYLSSSIQEFWQRWHISLGSWFREYVYIPLGGNQKGKKRMIMNVFIVFVLTGIWHGASYNFVIWGMYYGVLQVIERLGLNKVLKLKYLRPFAHVYTLLAVIFGWVIFRANNLHHGVYLIKRMLTPWLYTTTDVVFWDYTKNITVFCFIIGVLFAGPMQALIGKCPKIKALKYGMAECILCGVLLLLCMSALVANTYNPFIYFRF